MALENLHHGEKRMSDDCSSSRISSSSTLEIVLDDQSISNSGDEESNDQIR